MKDFDQWNKEKKLLSRTGYESLFFHEREIWWCSLGLNLGEEQDGKNDLYERPVLVLKKFNNKIAWVLPMTSHARDGKYYYQLEYNGSISSVILSQIRLVSVKRFRRIVRKISQHQFQLIRMKIIDFLKEDL